MILVDGENCLPNILTIFYFGDKISYENVRGSHPAAKKIEIMGYLCDSYFSWFVPEFVLSKLFRKIHPLSDTQCRTNVASDRHFPQIPYNAHSACKESNEERKKSPKMFCKVESYCHLGNVRGQGWDQLLMICDIHVWTCKYFKIELNKWINAQLCML